LLRMNLPRAGGCTFVTAALDPGKAKEGKKTWMMGPLLPRLGRIGHPSLALITTHSANTRDRLGRGFVAFAPPAREKQSIGSPLSLLRKNRKGNMNFNQDER
jgi:hypothetical protein